MLAAILFVVTSEETALHGASLLVAYAVGIGLSYLAAALGAKPFIAFMKRFRATFTAWSK